MTRSFAQGLPASTAASFARGLPASATVRNTATESAWQYCQPPAGGESPHELAVRRRISSSNCRVSSMKAGEPSLQAAEAVAV